MSTLLSIALAFLIILALPFVLASIKLTIEILADVLDYIGVSDLLRDIFDNLMREADNDG